MTAAADRSGLRVAGALVAGLSAGALVRASGRDLGAWVEGVEAIGGVWLNLLRMTVVPLVASLVVLAIAQVSDVVATGRMAGRTLALFAGLLVGAALYGVAATELALLAWPLDPDAAAALRAGVDPTGAPMAQVPQFATWVRSIVPANALAAAANDQILPVVVFSLAFGFGATRIAPQLRASLLVGLSAVSQALIAVVRAVSWAAPVGVFALAAGVGARAGIGVAAVLFQYVVIVSGVTAGIIAVAFAIAVVGGVPLGRFARAVAPVLVLAFSTQSSLACLPVMLERSRGPLGVSERVAGLVLPLAVAIFRLTSPVANLSVVLFVAAVHDVHPTAGQLAAGVVVALAVGIGSVGLPGQVSFFATVAPIGLTVGVPLELLPVLLAVEVVPDLFRTMGNVAADLAVTAVVSRFEDQEPASAPPAGNDAARG